MTAAVACLLALAAAGAAGPGHAQQAGAEELDRYETDMVAALERIGVTPEQDQAFRALVKEFFEKRNGALRLVSTTGDFKVRLRQKLNRIRRECVADMARVLRPEQLEHYDAFIRIANRQYRASVGL